MEAIPQGGLYEPDYIQRAPSEIRNGTYFERGDILVSKITPSFENGKQALAAALRAPFGVATTEVIPLRPKDNGHDRRFLFFYLLHPEIRQHVAGRMEGSTGRQRVPTEVLLDLPLPAFDPQEQRAIADSLEMVQRLSAVEAASVRTATALKRAAMHTLFTRGLRGETQKETQIGPMPVTWEMMRLETLCRSTDTVDLRSEADRTIEYVDVSSISREYLHIETTSQHVLKQAPGRARKRILSGDVVLATVRPTLLRVAVVPEKLDNQVCSTAFCVLRRNREKIEDRFIYYAVQREQFMQQLGEIETGASYPAVTDSMVKEQAVPVPPMDEQQEIVAILDTIDYKRGLHRSKRAVLEELFKALLHKLMTGEIRVRELRLAAG